MKVREIFGLVMVAILATGCTRVAPSYTGVLVSNWATDDKGGVEAKGRGAVFYNPLTQDLFVFPLHQQREEAQLQVRSKDNATITLNVGYTYKFLEPAVPALFKEYRRDPEDIIDVFLNDRVRVHMNNQANQMEVMQIIGQELNTLQTEAAATLASEWVGKGVEITNLSILGKPEVDATVEQAINATITAMNQANKAREQVRQAEFEAESKRKQAQGDADSTMIRAKAEADAAALLEKTLTPLVLQNHAISKWNGILPSVTTSGAVPFIQVPGQK